MLLTEFLQLIYQNYIQKEIYSIRDDDPLSATVQVNTSITMSRGAWNTRTETNSKMTADKTHYFLEATLCAYEGVHLVLSRSWCDQVPRDHLLNLGYDKFYGFFHLKPTALSEKQDSEILRI